MRTEELSSIIHDACQDDSSTAMLTQVMVLYIHDVVVYGDDKNVYDDDDDDDDDDVGARDHVTIVLCIRLLIKRF